MNVVAEKLSRELWPLGTRAGGLTDQAAAWTGLRPGTPVAVANLDAHVSVPACGVREPGRMVMIMGTSICHLVLGAAVHPVAGMCGAVEDGIIPGYWGFEAGQSCVGDGFAWFVETCVPAAYQDEARRRRLTIHALLEHKAAALRPGESGLLALDWLNGNRSILVDVDLTGLLVGLTIATRPEEIYRTLIEATAFGTRTIIETFVTSGVPITDLVACGGLPERNRLLMQIYADVTGLPIRVAAASQTPALGAAMHGAVAAGEEQGGYASILEAAARMGHLRPDVYQPDAQARAVYDRLYAEYRTLHDSFGRGGNDVMKRLGALRAETKARAGTSETRDVAEGEEVEAAARED
jgi:L-ribulokinase